MTTKEEIRPIYQELQGYLSQAPIPKTQYDALNSTAESLWINFNKTIEELNSITGNNYDKFRMIPFKSYGSDNVNLNVYRMNLGALIDRLHADYFSNEDRPFSAIPSTVVSQSQIQQQSMRFELLLEFQEKIIEKIHDNETSPEEKNFFEKVKEGLRNVNSVMGLILLILKTANDLGIDPGKLFDFFKSLH